MAASARFTKSEVKSDVVVDKNLLKHMLTVTSDEWLQGLTKTAAALSFLTSLGLKLLAEGQRAGCISSNNLGFNWN